MPIESKTLTAQRIRKEKALASVRELQLEQLRGKLISVVEVEQTWAGDHQAEKRRARDTLSLRGAIRRPSTYRASDPPRV